MGCLKMLGRWRRCRGCLLAWDGFWWAGRGEVPWGRGGFLPRWEKG